MNISKGVRASVVIKSLFACVMAMLCGIGSPAFAQALKLTPASDHPTATDKLGGSGFGASEAVDIYFDTTEILLVVTTSTGAITTHQWTVPGSALPGQHWITAIGRKSGDAAQKPFTVETDWTQRGYGAHSKRTNPYENVLNATNVSSLDIAWSATTGSFIVQSSPAVANGVVYVGSYDDKLYAYNATTGALLWSATTGNAVHGSPAVANGVVYVGSKDDNLYAYNATTGALLWSATTG
jgi:outer membrane protein assembly factor BamB